MFGEEGCVRPEMVKVLAQTVEIPLESDDVCHALAPDVEFRVRDIVQEALKFMRHSKRNTLTTEDINCALRIRNAETMFGFVACEAPRYVQASTAQNGLFVAADRDLDLKHLVNHAIPAAPKPLRLTSHWLSVEGVQPLIPQNPQHPTEQNAEDNKQQKQQQTARTQSLPHVTPLQNKKCHPLTKEHRLYFDKVIGAVRGNERELFCSTLNNISREVGIHQLLPYFCDFLETEVRDNLRNLGLLLKLIAFAQSLLDNHNLNLEPYLHQLLPTVLTCVVGKRLCGEWRENHWALRDRAARLAVAICARWSHKHRELQARVTSTLTKAFADISKPRTTHYGAIVGLAAFGPRVIHTELLPHLQLFVSHVTKQLEADNTQGTALLEVQMCISALLGAIGSFLFCVPRMLVPVGTTMGDVVDAFGDGVVAFLPPLPAILQTSPMPQTTSTTETHTQMSTTPAKNKPRKESLIAQVPEALRKNSSKFLNRGAVQPDPRLLHL